MIALKAIQASLIPIKHAFFPTRKLPISRNSIPCLCKNNDSDGNDSVPESPSSPEGDTRQQELLAAIAMLQTQKVRLTEYLDERAEYLTQFAEEANAEFDQVGEDAFREIQEAGDSIMENIESKMQAFRESQELNKLALMALLVVEIADSFINSPDWRKVAVLGAILVALFTQFVHEQTLLSEA